MTSESPELARAFADDTYRESLAAASTPVARFLQRAGAYFRPMHEEIDFTDWNGAIVGRGAGAEIRAAIPPDPELPFIELAPLLLMGRFARELVARHPSTPTEVLLELAGVQEYDVQDAILARTTNDPSVLERLRESTMPTIRTRAGGTESEPPIETKEQLLAKARDPDASARWVVARRSTLPKDVMEMLAADPAIDVRWAIARRPDLTPAALERIMELELAPKIVDALAANPATPSSALVRLATVTFPASATAQQGRYIRNPWPTTTAEVRVLIARRPSLPREMAVEYARDQDSRVREAIAANPSTEPALLDQLIDDPTPTVRVAIAKHPRFTNLALLATDPSPDVCAVLADRKDATPEVLEALSRDASSRVRAKVAARIDTPRAVLERLVEDSQTFVRETAKQTLATLRSPSS